MTDEKIRMQPMISFPDMVWWRMSHPKIEEKTDSRLMIRDARAGFKDRWPTA
jgi:hypothetical protein